VSDASALEAVRDTREWKASKAQLADRNFRLNNLYSIKNADGLPVPFKRNAAQRIIPAGSGSGTRS
jgi:hypothetical protein